MEEELDENCGAFTEEENQPAGNTQADLKPEFCQYKDEGCEYAQACLACPFPGCLYEEGMTRQRWQKAERDREINRLYQSGRKVKELAKLFRVSRKTIRRALGEKK